MMGVKGISYEGGDMPKARDVERDLSDYVAKIDGLLRDWQAAQLRAVETMREVSAVIEDVGHVEARRVLMLHFIDGKSYEKIAKLIPCCSNAVYKYRRIGLNEIVERKSQKNKNE